MKVKYVVDENGRLLAAEKFLKREAKDWAGALGTFAKEWGDTGKQFLKDIDQTASQFGSELTGTPKSKKKKGK